MAAIVQKGTTLKIGYGSAAYTGFVFQSFSREATGEQKVLKNTDNATMTVLVEDLGNRYTFSALILDANGSIVPPAVGSTITITNPSNVSTAGRVESSSVAHTAEESILNVTMILETSMTYT